MVFDTGVVIDFVDGLKYAVDAVGKYSVAGAPAITFITQYELLKYRGKRAKLIRNMLVGFKVYHSDDYSAESAAQIYNSLRDKGTLINENDILIAGIALANGEKLVASDQDFKQIESDRIMVLDSTETSSAP